MIEVSGFKIINEEANLAHFHITDEDEHCFKTISPGNLAIKTNDGEKFILYNCLTYGYGDCSENDHRVQVFFDRKEDI